MVINRYLRCLFGHKKVIVEILRSSFIGALKDLGNFSNTKHNVHRFTLNLHHLKIIDSRKRTLKY